MVRLARKNKQPQSIVSLDLRLRLSLRKITLIIAHNVHMLNPPLLGDGIIVTRHLGSSSNLQIPESATVVKSSLSNGEVTTGKKWIDGKTIYRRCAAGTTTSSLVTAIGTIASIDNVINLSIMIKNTSDGGWRAIPWLFNTLSSTDWQGGAYITSGGQLVFQAGALVGSSSKCIAIIEYTKA